MRKVSSYTPLRLLMLGLLIMFVGGGCKKTDLRIGPNEQANKVLTFLESEKITGHNNVNKNANIDMLKENLDFVSAVTESLDNKLDLLIIPINDDVIQKKNLDKNSTLSLLLIMDKNGSINSGSIIYFLPEDGKKLSSLPKNNFSKILTGKKGGIDGEYRMLTTTGRWLSQYEVKDGKLVSVGTVKQKDDANNIPGNLNTEACVDWYLVITYYWSDGTTTQESEYIGTTCDNCESGNYQSLCPPEGGGGSCSPCGDYSGQETGSSSKNILYPGDIGMTGNTNSDFLSVIFSAFVSYTYSYDLNQFTLITPYKPIAVPPVQAFIDDNGVLASCVVNIGAWGHSTFPLTIKSAYVHWTFVETETFYYSTGIMGPFTFNESFSKVIAVP